MNRATDDVFDGAFVAVSYLLGRREEPASGLAVPSAAALRVAASFASPERAVRARALSQELAPIAAELATRGLS